TVINPKSTTILGWIWNSGTLSASPHRIATLASCQKPETVYRLRSFIGAFKVLSRVIPGCSSLLSKLDDAVAGRQSKEQIQWTDELHAVFCRAQAALSAARTITLPKPEDQIWIVTDGAIRSPGIGATLYVTRNGKLRVAGFFSAKLRGSQVRWLPCEVEALSIAVAVKHFSPYLIQSHHQACILTDSKPCVQAYEKLCRGEFSASPRVSTFLSTVSRYQASVRHVSGSAILPSDFASRNAAPCEDEACQICSFTKQTQDSVIRRAAVQDILSGVEQLPFTNRATWGPIQAECPELRRTRAHLLQGTRPSKKLTNVTDVKRYFLVATIAKDGLLVVKRNEPLVPSRECIIIPRQVLEGLLTAPHIRLSHPSSHQLKVVVKRYLFALDMDKVVNRVSESCHHCAALRKTPTARIEQSSCSPPSTVGVAFAADIAKRSKQLIFVLRECVTSLTATTLLENEHHDTLRDALIRNRSCEEPQQESCCRKSGTRSGGPVSHVTLAVATANLNSRIRTRGLSAREMWSQRDQFSNEQIPLQDQDIIMKQNEQRTSNHAHSEKSKAPVAEFRTPERITVGDLVYLYSDRNKTRARDRYLVVEVKGPFCNVKKFVGSQLRNTSYHVKISECYRVPSELKRSRQSTPNDEDSSADEAESSQPPMLSQVTPPPPAPPSIPTAISTPPSQTSHCNEPSVNANAYCKPSNLEGEPHTEDESRGNEYVNGPGESVPLRRSSRQRRPPERFGDYSIQSGEKVQSSKENAENQEYIRDAFCGKEGHAQFHPQKSDITDAQTSHTSQEPKSPISVSSTGTLDLDPNEKINNFSQSEVYHQKPSKEKADPSWISTGVRKWHKMKSVGKNKQGKLAQHFSLQSHKASLAAYCHYLKKTKHVDIQLDKAKRAAQIQEAEDLECNHKVIHILLNITRTLAWQALPFRGDSNEEGNFYQLVLLVTELREKFVEEVKSAGMFSVMTDTTPDEEHTDRRSVVLRYVKDAGKPTERLLDVRETVDQTGLGQAKDILSTIEQCGVDTNNLCFQSYE
ncbi:Hypothetical predicted protein, partial [Paramuricea clavata]